MKKREQQSVDETIRQTPRRQNADRRVVVLDETKAENALAAIM